MSSWVGRGEIDVTSVTRIVMSPDYSRDRTLVVATPAGLSVSRDAGETWERPGRGVIGPFVRDVALSPSFSRGGVGLATVPTGLALTRDGGVTWSMSETAAATGAVTFISDRRFLVVADEDGAVWQGDVGDSSLCKIGDLPDMALEIAVALDHGAVAAVTGSGLFTSRDEGATWEAVSLPGDFAVQAVAVLGPSGLAVATADDGVLIGDGSGAWSLPAALRGRNVLALASDRTGSVIVAGSTDGFFVSGDCGRSWAGPAGDVAVLGLALAPDGSTLWVGSVGHGCRVSEDLGGAWRASAHVEGAVVVELAAAETHLIARTAEGLVAESLDGGSTWRRPSLPNQDDVTAVAVGPTAEQAIYAVGERLVVGRGAVLPAPCPCPIHRVVRGSRDHSVVAVADKRHVFVSHDCCLSWDEQSPPIGEGDVIVDLALGEGGSTGDVAIAVGTIDGAGRAAVWMTADDLPWRRVIAHPEPVHALGLAAVRGPRGLYAAMGDSVYRPARVGAMLYAREIINREPSADVLQIAAVRAGDDEVVVAVLTASGIDLSRDGGLSWARLPRPDGPPVTALTLHHTNGGVEVIAVLLGGGVRSHRLNP